MEKALWSLLNGLDINLQPNHGGSLFYLQLNIMVLFYRSLIIF